MRFWVDACCTQHTFIHPSKASGSAVFSIYSKLCNCHNYLLPEYFFFYHLRKKPHACEQAFPHCPLSSARPARPRGGAGGSPQCSARAPPTRSSVSGPRPLVQHAREDVNTEGYGARSEFKGGARMKSRPGFTRNFLLSPDPEVRTEVPRLNRG